ncbi:MAG TPA: Hpt domain-containing protein [Cytophagaceae bacterium]
MTKYPSINMEAEGLKIILEFAEVDANLLIELIESVIDSSPLIISNLQKAISSNDITNTKLYSHSLKSSANLIGASELYLLCRNMENNCSNGMSIEEINALFNSILSEYKNVISDLKLWRADMKC